MSADVEASYQLLPFADESFDLLVCPHIQELVPCEARFFAELSRVMMSEGLLVLYGVNPMGVLQLSNWGGLGNTFAWQRRVYYRKILGKMLESYGFEYVYHGYGVHQFSLGQEKDVMRLSRWLPSCGGVYKLVLRRRRVTPAVCVAEEWGSQSMEF
jgi:ubiquinone/menaquinone biosynthesis C-methylase UbiE